MADTDVIRWQVGTIPISADLIADMTDQSVDRFLADELRYSMSQMAATARLDAQFGRDSRHRPDRTDWYKATRPDRVRRNIRRKGANRAPRPHGRTTCPEPRRFHVEHISEERALTHHERVRRSDPPHRLRPASGHVRRLRVGRHHGPFVRASDIKVPDSSDALVFVDPESWWSDDQAYLCDTVARLRSALEQALTCTAIWCMCEAHELLRNSEQAENPYG